MNDREKNRGIYKLLCNMKSLQRWEFNNNYENFHYYDKLVGKNWKSVRLINDTVYPNK